MGSGHPIMVQGDAGPPPVGVAITAGFRRAASGADFRFMWSGIAFRVQLGAASATGDSPLVLTAELGPLPYSAENQLARRRLRRFLPPVSGGDGGHLRLAPDQTIIFENRTAIRNPPSPAAMVTAITVCLLQIGPIVELLTERPSADGTAGVRDFALAVG